MDNLPAVKIGQSIQHTLCHFTKDFLARPSPKLPDPPVYTVETAPFAEFHDNGYRTRGFIHKGTIVPTNVIRRTVLVKVEFSNDLLLDVRVGIRRDDL